MTVYRDAAGQVIGTSRARRSRVGVLIGAGDRPVEEELERAKRLVDDLARGDVIAAQEALFELDFEFPWLSQLPANPLVGQDGFYSQTLLDALDHLGEDADSVTRQEVIRLYGRMLTYEPAWLKALQHAADDPAPSVRHAVIRYVLAPVLGTPEEMICAFRGYLLVAGRDPSDPLPEQDLFSVVRSRQADAQRVLRGIAQGDPDARVRAAAWRAMEAAAGATPEPGGAYRASGGLRANPLSERP